MATLTVIHSGNSPLPPHSVESSKYHDDAALSNVITYCCQASKTPHSYIRGFAINPKFAIAQMAGLAQAYGKANGLRLRHMVLSFDSAEQISPYLADQIAYQAAWYYAPTYQILYAVHEDTPHSHIHLVLNTVSYIDGKKYAGKKEDYFRFQQHLKTVLSGYGLNLTVAS